MVGTSGWREETALSLLLSQVDGTRLRAEKEPEGCGPEVASLSLSVRSRAETGSGEAGQAHKALRWQQAGVRDRNPGSVWQVVSGTRDVPRSWWRRPRVRTSLLPTLVCEVSARSMKFLSILLGIQ